MPCVADETEQLEALPVSAAICLDRDAFERIGQVLRHLSVGLVDQAINVRLLSSDPRVESLALGPVQSIVHQRAVWPVTSRRTEAILDALSPTPPTVVHAMSGESYRLAAAVAAAFDADLVCQVTSLADCSALSDLSLSRVGRLAAFSQPLVQVLEDQLKMPAELVDLIRPGIRASKRAACFAEPGRTPTILCLAPLDRRSGVDRLIETMHILRKRELEFMLFLLGSGRRESFLRRRIRERGLTSYITLAQPAGDLSRATHSADIFVCPSQDATFAGDALQAMGAGMVVATFPNVLCDHYRDGETVVVCKKSKAEALADVIEHLIEDRSEARRIAQGAMEYVRTHHSVSGMVERVAEVYRELALRRTTFAIKE